MKNISGFSLIELVAVIVIIAIIAAVAVPKFLDTESTARQNTTTSVARALNVASSVNKSLSQAGSPKAVTVANCTNVANALPDGAKLPSGYSITSQSISIGAVVTCTVTNPDGTTTATFLGRGIA